MPTHTTESPGSSSLCHVPTPEEKLVRILGGAVTLTGLGLGFFVSEWWYLLTLFAGANLLQSAFTGFCPPEIVYRLWKRSPETK
ncbi:DUF2892 domain-containing protein [Salinibacter sp. 10B]|uniref:YgaP family membrane protein n=1 Tax=Salinibacter sp. 10B TaxID=1923971 RepID=UPI000CF3635D|nr:DUF2892 domain-containing protein [Salinibacter sp. 10B]